MCSLRKQFLKDCNKDVQFVPPLDRSPHEYLNRQVLSHNFLLDKVGVMPYSDCHKEVMVMPEEKKDPKVLLGEAVRKRDELNTFIKVLQEMIGSETVQGDITGGKPIELPPTGEVADPLAVVYPGMFFGKSQPQAVKLLLERVKRPLKTRFVLECLEKGGMKVGGKKPAVNLWGVLNRNSETFILVRKAGWGLVEWYEPGVIAKYRKEGGKEGEENNGNSKE